MADTAASAPILVVDIGGTNTRLGLARDGRVMTSSIAHRINAAQDGPVGMLTRYLATQGVVRPAGVCVAVAGPVMAGEAHMTNLDWHIDEDTLSRALGGVPVVVLNDLQAQGHAVGHLPTTAVMPILDRVPADGPRLIVGVGTGFNAAVVHDHPSGRHVTASEAGHATLPCADPQIAALAAHLARTVRPEIEEAVSGRGLIAIDRFLGHAPREGAEIIAAAAACPAARATVEMFTRILGAVTGDLALIHLPWGGIHLVGGMARAVSPWLGSPVFADAFADKGRMTPLMRRFPIWLVTDDDAALTGCARHMAGRMAHMS